MTAFLPPPAPGPGTHAVAVTPSDSTALTPTTAIYVGGAGDLAVLLSNDTVAVTLKAVPIGTVLLISAKKVMATNTTATNIVAFS